MRGDVQDIFRMTPHEKQVMMFSATLSKEIRPICKKFMQDVIMAPSLWQGCHTCLLPSNHNVAAATGVKWDTFVPAAS